MALDADSPSIRLINRALRVTQRLVKRISNGGTLNRDELRAGELATQALRSCIADPGNAHRSELLIQEADRLAPNTFEPRREQRPERRPPDPRRGNPRNQGAPTGRPPAKPRTPKPSTAKVIVKKKPKIVSRES
jgi:hypothetical protein